MHPPYSILTPGDSLYPPWMEKATSYYGVKETPGPEATPEILYFLGHARKLPAQYRDKDETNWCAAFVSACLHEANYASPMTSWARAFLSWGQGLEQPTFGCVCVIKRKASDAGVTAMNLPGHVGFLVGGNAEQLELLGGNQGNAVSVARYSMDRLLSYRWPIRRR